MGRSEQTGFVVLIGRSSPVCVWPPSRVSNRYRKRDTICTCRSSRHGPILDPFPADFVFLSPAMARTLGPALCDRVHRGICLISAIVVVMQVSPSPKAPLSAEPAELARALAGLLRFFTHASDNEFMREVQRARPHAEPAEDAVHAERAAVLEPPFAQGSRRATRHLPPRRQPRRRPPGPARPGGTPRGQRRPPDQAGQHDRRGRRPGRAADGRPGQRPLEELLRAST